MSADTIILVHGLWMTGMEMSLLKHRLESEHGYHCVMFSYASVTGDIVDHVRKLRELAQQQPCERLHFVGHSLGGVVAFKLLESTPDLPPGRAVFLGSPLQGSRAARAMASSALGRMMIGETVVQELVSVPERRWTVSRELGVIAGSDSVGLGRLLDAQLASDSDGTVLVEETRIDGAADRIVLPVGHTAMLFDTQVCEQLVHFLRHGRFRRAA